MKIKLFTVMILIIPLFCFINNNVYCIAPTSGLLQKSNTTNNAWLLAWFDAWPIMKESVHAFLMPRTSGYGPEAIAFLENVFLEVQNLSDKDVLDKLKQEIKARNYGATDKLRKGYHFSDPYNLRTLFIAVTAEESIMGTMKGLLPYCYSETFDYLILDDEEELEKHKNNIAFYYLLFRGMDILSTKDSLVLIQEEDIEPLTQLLLAYDVKLKQFLTIAKVLVPANSPSKKEAVINMFKVIEQVSRSNKQWHEDMKKQNNSSILDSLRQSGFAVESASGIPINKSL